MRPFVLALALIATLPAPLRGADTTTRAAVEAWQADPTRIFDASEVELADFRWIARPVVVFADTEADPRFREQMAHLAARPAELATRDVVVIVDTDPEAETSVRRKLRPRGFMLAVLGKDGGVKLRKPFPWDIREITRSIDKMPMRQEEIRNRNSGG